MRLECYQSEELQAKIAEYEATIGHPFSTDGFDNYSTAEIIRCIDTLIAHGVQLNGRLSDDEIRWRNKCDEYVAYFGGHGIPRGYGAPASREKCCAIMSDCIERGEPYDPYANIDGDPAYVEF